MSSPNTPRRAEIYPDSYRPTYDRDWQPSKQSPSQRRSRSPPNLWRPRPRARPLSRSRESRRLWRPRRSRSRSRSWRPRGNDDSRSRDWCGPRSRSPRDSSRSRSQELPRGMSRSPRRNDGRRPHHSRSRRSRSSRGNYSSRSHGLRRRRSWSLRRNDDRPLGTFPAERHWTRAAVRVRRSPEASRRRVGNEASTGAGQREQRKRERLVDGHVDFSNACAAGPYDHLRSAQLGSWVSNAEYSATKQ